MLTRQIDRSESTACNKQQGMKVTFAAPQLLSHLSVPCAILLPVPLFSLFFLFDARRCPRFIPPIAIYFTITTRNDKKNWRTLLL
jgi:hypothetical protein